MCRAIAWSLAFAFVMASALLRVDADRDDFIDWMNERGTTVDDVLHSCDVRPHWHRLLCEMRAWLAHAGRCTSSLPRADLTFDEIAAQRRIVRLLAPQLDDHASVFCAAVATALALTADEPTDLLQAIDVALTDDQPPQHSSQRRPVAAAGTR